jgi:hypothetical protein
LEDFSTDIQDVNIYDIFGQCYGLSADGLDETKYSRNDMGFKMVGRMLKGY